MTPDGSNRNPNKKKAKTEAARRGTRDVVESAIELARSINGRWDEAGNRQAAQWDAEPTKTADE